VCYLDYFSHRCIAFKTKTKKERSLRETHETSHVQNSQGIKRMRPGCFAHLQFGIDTRTSGRIDCVIDVNSTPGKSAKQVLTPRQIDINCTPDESARELVLPCAWKLLITVACLVFSFLFGRLCSHVAVARACLLQMLNQGLKHAARDALWEFSNN